MPRVLHWTAVVAVTLAVATMTGPAAAEIQVRWDRTVGTALAAVATDASGRTVVTGATRTGPGGRVVVASFAPDGAALWSDTWRPSPDSWAYGSAVDVDPTDRVLVAGAVWTPLDIDAPTTWFLRAYTSGGRVRWTRLGPGWRDASGSTFATGVAAGPGGIVLVGSVCAEGGCEGGWVRSYTGRGSLRWTRTVGGIHGTAEDVAVAATGVAYVTGAFNVASGPPGEGNHAFVTAIRPTGSSAWTHRFVGPQGTGTAVDVHHGRTVVGGDRTFGTVMWLATLAPDGAQVWRITSRHRAIADVDVGPTGWIWLTGRRWTGGTTALFLQARRPDGTLAAAWLRDPGGTGARGGGVAAGPHDVSVAGASGGQGRVWLLRV